MGAGVSDKVVNQQYHKTLKRIAGELEKSGVASELRELTLMGNNSKRDAFWSLRFRTIRASNGETAGLPEIQIWHPEGDQRFEYERYAQGISEIKRIFGC